MKSIFSLIIFLIFSNYCTAHKTKIKIQNFENVKTLYISEFNFGEKTVSAEELKMEILGKLSKQIADKLGFKDTIMLERKTYMYPNKSNLFIIEQNDANYKLLKLGEGYEKMEGGSGVAIRVQSLNVDIEDFLKIVEYAIINRKKLSKSLIPVNYFYNDDKMSILANSDEFIQKIIRNKSDLVNEIIQSEILLVDNGFSKTKISWKNGEFVFGFNDVPPTNENYFKLENEKFTIKDFKYYIENTWNDFFVVFHDSDYFTYFDGREENTSSQKMDENISDFYPFRLNKDKISNKIILIPFRSDVIYIYKINKKLLQKIE